MERREFAVFASALRTYYPRENLLPNDHAMELWFRQLEDVPYQLAEVALQKWVATNKWSPSIAEIREMTVSITDGEMPDWGEGWEQVLRAIRRCGSYDQASAMDMLDDVTRKCVERLGYRNLCMSENINQDRANFRMLYEQIAERKKKEAVLPTGLLQTISMMRLGTQERIGIEGGKREW